MLALHKVTAYEKSKNSLDPSGQRNTRHNPGNNKELPYFVIPRLARSSHT